jgi:hypothetical protein
MTPCPREVSRSPAETSGERTPALCTSR